MSRTIHSDITLAAPPAAVWAVLADFPAYPAWNPFIRHIAGPAEAGAKLCIRWAPTLRWSMPFSATLVDWQPERTLGWAGGPRWLLHGHHVIRLQASADGQGTVLMQEETFSGLLTPLLFWVFGRDPARGYREMNRALKERLATPPQ